MRGRRAAWIAFGACLQACFMSGYDALRGSSDAGDAGPIAPDAGAPDTGAELDAWSPGLDAASCAFVDAAAPAAPCDGGLCPPQTTNYCADICELPACDPCDPCEGSCNVDGCGINCPSGRNCVLECVRAACESICAWGASCHLKCSDEKSCRVTCDPGSSCNVDCGAGEQCSVACKPGAQCALKCAAGARCDFVECSTSSVRCGDVTYCNSFGCPPP